MANILPLQVDTWQLGEEPVQMFDSDSSDESDVE